MSMERLLGQRFAPRIGAVLVFLATLFFLGVAVQRGWIGPAGQLGLATLVAAVLLGWAAWLTRQKGYGTYPQVLEATGACILYAVAFSAHAVPYYRAATGLDATGGGFLMALVAAGTVGLALHRDSRVIAGLGYLLGFLTAGLGWGVLPGLTLAYVAILGASLALLVSWKGWLAEGLAGSLVTGLFMGRFALDAFLGNRAAPPAESVALAAALPAAAFVWLALRPARREDGEEASFAPTVGFLTLAWLVPVTLAAMRGREAVGTALAAWCAAALGLAWLAVRIGSHRGVPAAFGLASLLLYVLWPLFLFPSGGEGPVMVTLTYGAGALALAAAQSRLARGRSGLWHAALALAFVAAARAVFLDRRLFVQRAAPVGDLEAWTTFAVLLPAFALLVALAPPAARAGPHRLAFAGGMLFAGAWTFALFGTPFLTTLWLAVLGGALVAAALRYEGDLSRDALTAALLFLAAAAAKTATWDVHLARPRQDPLLATLQTVLVAGILLAVHHLGVARRGRLDAASADLAGQALVGGSAAVLASFAFAYGEDEWVSILLGALGVAYLAAGFVLRGHAVYRYVGFAALGFVLLRVFLVDLRETDLVVRALVFAVLGAILLGIGYAYARISRGESLPPPAQPPEAEPPEGSAKP